jgi:hypothetical protein
MASDDLRHVGARADQVDVTRLTREDVADLRAQVLADVGLTLDQLRAEARRGRFSSVVAHDAWHLITGLGGAGGDDA